LTHRVLIAAELKNLLEPSQLTDLDITWLAADQPTPKGDWVAIVPLLSRWVGGMHRHQHADEPSSEPSSCVRLGRRTG